MQAIIDRRRLGSSPIGAVRPGLGFTLVELSALIAIIGILVALLLAAVRVACKAAQRFNNVKNLALKAIFDE
jgi:type II secretory pathway pseudopilin PulG